MPAMKDLVNGVPRYRHFINGQWTDSTVKEWIEVENPATGAVIAMVPKGSADDADRALVAAAAAQPAWEALPPIERAKLLIGLSRLGASVEEVGEQIFQLILKTASGQRTKSELLGYGEDEFAPWHLGATL